MTEIPKQLHKKNNSLAIALLIIVLGVGLSSFYEIYHQTTEKEKEIKNYLNEHNYSVEKIYLDTMAARTTNGSIYLVEEVGCSGCGDGWILTNKFHLHAGCECPDLKIFIPITIITISIAISTAILKRNDDEEVRD